ncbi:MAG: radical SAM protein [Candidatus Latescibacteria bacterium]|nr:radical SAM protein [bacterium]MBD3423518.1 radical SAM protein [Candidatus Latescibacterota bacterium]
MDKYNSNPLNIKHLSLILTANCNLACRYCYQNYRRDMRMSWKTAKEAIKTALGTDSRVLEISFMGGEPLLEFELIGKAVRYIRKYAPEDKRIKLSISTNGTLMDGGKIDFLAENRFDTQLSFDGVAGAQDHRAPGSFRVLDALLDRLRNDYRPFFRHHLSIAYTLAPSAIEYLSGSIRYFINKGIPKITVYPVINHQPGWKEEMACRLESQLAEIYRMCLEHYHSRGKVPVTIFRGKYPESLCVEPEEGAATCGAPYPHSIAVDTDGEVYGCTVFARSYQEFANPFLALCSEHLRMGRIGTPRFLTSLSHFPGRALSLGIFDEKSNKYSPSGSCSRCRYLSDCNICPASIPHIPGNRDPRKVPSFPCAWNRTAMKYRERFPAVPDPRAKIEGPPGVEDDIKFWRKLAGKTGHPERGECRRQKPE